MTGTIRPFHLDDYPAAHALWLATEGVCLVEADSRPGIGRFLHRNPGCSFAAVTDEGALQGTILAGHDGRRGFIYHLCVAADHRRRGLGRALVDRAVAALDAQGIAKCHLLVKRPNDEAVDFWISVGWHARSDVDLLSAWLADTGSRGVS